MSNESKGSHTFEELRRKAERLLQEQSVDFSQYPADIPKLIQELQVHQIELEVQNEELKRTQEEVGKLHREYQDLYEFAPCTYITLDSQGIITRCNLKGLTLLGAERSNLTSKALSNFMTRKSRKAFFFALQEARFGELQDEELELISEQGRTFWVWANIRVESGQDDGSEQWQIVLMDITKRKQAEESLEFERSQFLSILDSIGEIIYIADPRTYEILFVNKYTQQLLGQDPVGGHCYQKFQNKDSSCEFCTNDIVLQKNGAPHQWELYNAFLDKHLFITDKIINWPDGRDVKFEIAFDISERKRFEVDLEKKEALLAQTQQIAQVGSWELDLQENRLTWSDQAYRIFGLQAQEFSPTYEAFLRYVHPEDRAKVDTAYSGSVAKSLDNYDLEHRIIRQDTGEIRHVHEKCFHVRSFNWSTSSDSGTYIYIELSKPRY